MGLGRCVTGGALLGLAMFMVASGVAAAQRSQTRILVAVRAADE